MSKIGLFYAPALGSTEKVARIVAEKIGTQNVELKLVDENTTPAEIQAYDKLIFGISTVGRDNWDSSYSDMGWDFLIPKLEDVDFGGKTVAIFGLGNQVLYPDNFVDGMGILAARVEVYGGETIGEMPSDEYDFNDSEATNEKNMFVGVAIDEDNEPNLTEARIDAWLAKIKAQFGV